MNALLLVDKPGGLTSHDVVARVRRFTGERSVGHLGTLDPMATGLLPLLLGKWTRLAKFYSALPKTYTGVIRFGYSTDTYDADGNRDSPMRWPELDLLQLQELAVTFLGETEQMPPAFSAKKIGGKAAYTLARAGQTPVLRPVRILVDAFTVDDLSTAEVDSFRCQDAHFSLRISAGGYVRSVAHTMGQRLQCGAHLTALRRVAAGPFVLAQALTLAEVEQRAAEGTLESTLPHPRTLLPELPCVTADAETLVRLRNGMAVPLPEFSRAAVVKVFAGQSELAAVAQRLAGTLFQPKIVLL